MNSHDLQQLQQRFPNGDPVIIEFVYNGEGARSVTKTSHILKQMWTQSVADHGTPICQLIKLKVSMERVLANQACAAIVYKECNAFLLHLTTLISQKSISVLHMNEDDLDLIEVLQSASILPVKLVCGSGNVLSQVERYLESNMPNAFIKDPIEEVFYVGCD
ncbi:hypothetical protein P9112_007037 [Eukaryota sp. TZLM1-RC]